MPRRWRPSAHLPEAVAHDFNNLLMGILGYTSLMLMKTEKNPSLL